MVVVGGLGMVVGIVVVGVVVVLVGVDLGFCWVGVDCDVGI